MQQQSPECVHVFFLPRVLWLSSLLLQRTCGLGANSGGVCALALLLYIYL